MKKTIIIILSILSIGCKAQTEIIDILDRGEKRLGPDQYYQDTNDLLNTYEGVWVFSEGTQYLKFILEKKVSHYNGVYYEDVIIGGYEYKVNGVTLVNTLLDINSNYTYSIQYSLSADGFISSDFFPLCPECDSNEKRLMMSFSEPSSDLRGRIYARRMNIGGQEVLKIKLQGSSNKYQIAGNPPQPNDFVLPSGTYTLIKQ
ncbi:DUF6705 family protein [Flavobacterium sp.]|uniref:DUF6705 family protein n=1 Tax=Flavobacterium sp. TaxID=239 RepID=UPI0037500F4B